MKAVIKVSILMLLFTIPVFTQPPKSFFPSQVGNLWQYRWFGGPMWTDRINKDSLAADGSVFLFYNNHPDPLYRIDTSANVYMFPLSFNDQLYKLDADSGEAWVWFNNGFVNWYGWVARIEPSLIFGKLTTTKVIRLGPNHPDSCDECFWYREHHLASGFGVVFIWEEPGNVAFLSGCVIAGDTFGTLVSVAADEKVVPDDYHLAQNYPNPFNPVTNIEFSLPHEAFVRLTIYDLLGREVASLLNERRRAGKYRVTFDASNLSSGVYIMHLQIDKSILRRKMTLLK